MYNNVIIARSRYGYVPFEMECAENGVGDVRATDIRVNDDYAVSYVKVK